MGSEAEATLRWRGRTTKGKAYLETDFLLFRGGETRVKIPFKAMKEVEAKAGRLLVVADSGRSEFELGPLAAKWEEKILHPKGLIDKLGVRPDSRVTVLGVRDKYFWNDLRERTSSVADRLSEPSRDFVFLAAETRGDLRVVRKTWPALAPAGALWIVFPKGREEIRESDVLEVGRAAGLKDVKVVRFSETHTGLKFVLPHAARPRGKPR